MLILHCLSSSGSGDMHGVIKHGAWWFDNAEHCKKNRVVAAALNNAVQVLTRTSVGVLLNTNVEKSMDDRLFRN